MGAKASALNGRRVLLVVCGGIAAYKSVQLLRELTACGADVRVTMTPAAGSFVTPLTFRTLSGHPPLVELFKPVSSARVEHVSVAQSTELALIVPATANTIGKMVSGMADNYATTLLLALPEDTPVIVAPSMEEAMYRHPSTRHNLQTLRDWGYELVNPEHGPLASGLEGEGRLASLTRIIDTAEASLTKQDLSHCRILVTGGATREFLDPVRFLSNPSSGRTGAALARAARQRGAEVTFIKGFTTVSDPSGCEVVEALSTQAMYEAVLDRYPEVDVVVKSAAVSDYRPVKTAASKIEKTGDRLQFQLERTPDILAELGKRRQHQVLVGFAAETGQLDRAKRKLREKGLSFIVANDVSQADRGFSSETNQVELIHASGERESLPLLSKQVMAHEILDRVKPYLPT